MLLADPGAEAVQARGLGAGEEREHVARLRQEQPEHRARDLVEAPAGGDGPVVDEPEELALPDGDAVDLGIARGDRDGPGRERLERLVHLRHVRLRRAARVVDDERGEARRDRLGTHDADRLRREPRRLLGRHDDVRVVREDDDLGRGRRLDRVEDVLRGRVHRLAALDDPARPEAREQAPVALARDDGDDLRRLAVVRRRASPRSAAPRARPSARACSRSRSGRSCPGARRARAPRRGRRCGRAP